MERVRLTPPGVRRARGTRARLYVRWMPHIGAEAVALYELLRILPDIGQDSAELAELAELLRSTPESVEDSLNALIETGFVAERDGWMEVAEHPPGARTPVRAGARKEASAGKLPREERPVGERPAVESTRDGRPAGRSRGEHPSGERPSGERPSGERPSGERAREAEEEGPGYDIRVIRAEPEGVSADDYFRYMGSLPAPHILEFLNGYCERDGVSPDVVREALKIASERDARRVGYVRSILERWVERGVKTVEDVERFEKDRKLRLVEESGAVRGGALKIGEGGARKGVSGGADRQSAARRREGYEWLFGETE